MAIPDSPESAAREFVWRELESSPHSYSLQAAGREVGSLKFKDEAGRRATGMLNECEWTFERSGILHPHVMIRRTDSGEAVAELALRFTGSGVVTFSGGVRYLWQPDRVLGAKWCLRREGDDKLICFIQAGTPALKGARVVPCVDCSELPEFPVLVLLGWYLRVLMSDRFVAAAVSCEQ